MSEDNETNAYFKKRTVSLDKTNDSMEIVSNNSTSCNLRLIFKYISFF